LIASALPDTLKAESKQPYRIRLIVHPVPLRVAYATTATLVPQLIEEHSPDFILHIGVAGGRDYYALETLAHSSGYGSLDVDNKTGDAEAEAHWISQGVPESLGVGWDTKDVLDRWERGVQLNTPGTEQDESQLPMNGIPGGLVRLSTDAGRYLCEFSLMTSLAYRWLDAQSPDAGDLETERLGKAAFLHVPNGDTPEIIEKGVKVAVAAIHSLVASWESGRRASK
jgi:pyrrolidone-carboxylate peptidase